MAWKNKLAPWLKGIGIVWLIGAAINIIKNWLGDSPYRNQSIPVHVISDLIVIAPGIVLIIIAKKLRHPKK
jgi:hypothetical protein